MKKRLLKKLHCYFQLLDLECHWQQDRATALVPNGPVYRSLAEVRQHRLQVEKELRGIASLGE